MKSFQAIEGITKGMYRGVWERPEIIGKGISRKTSSRHGQTISRVALPMRRVAWVERDKIKQEVDKMR